VLSSVHHGGVDRVNVGDVHCLSVVNLNVAKVVTHVHDVVQILSGVRVRLKVDHEVVWVQLEVLEVGQSQVVGVSCQVSMVRVVVDVLSLGNAVLLAAGRKNVELNALILQVLGCVGILSTRSVLPRNHITLTQLEAELTHLARHCDVRRCCVVLAACDTLSIEDITPEPCWEVELGVVQVSCA
jgi:hypothetical protein